MFGIYFGISRSEGRELGGIGRLITSSNSQRVGFSMTIAPSQHSRERIFVGMGWEQTTASEKHRNGPFLLDPPPSPLTRAGPSRKHLPEQGSRMRIQAHRASTGDTAKGKHARGCRRG